MIMHNVKITSDLSNETNGTHKGKLWHKYAIEYI